MNNEATYFFKFDASRKNIKVNKKNWPPFALGFILCFVLFERSFIELGAPGSIIYVIDLVNLLLLFRLIQNKTWKRFTAFILIYLAMVVFGVLIAFASYGIWGGNPLFSAIEIRNIIRFPIFFLACVAFLNEYGIEKIFKILTIYFYINSAYILFQYFTYHPAGVWMRGDLLNGFFGTTTGGNTYVNALMVCVVSYWLCKWAEHRCSMRAFAIPLCVSVAIAGLIELKVFFIEVFILYLWYLISQRKTIKELAKNIFVVLAVIGVGYIALQYMYKEYPWFRDAMSLSGMFSLLTEGGYSNSQDLNRLTGILTVAGSIFKGDAFEILFGIGLGNAATYELRGHMTSFASAYSANHYSWFSLVYVFVQCGILGLLLYIYSFIYLFIKKKNKEYVLLSQTMCLMAFILIVLGEALKTDAGYFVYFAIACGFVKIDSFGKELKNSHIVKAQPVRPNII